jgi:hypothetical protein
MPIRITKTVKSSKKVVLATTAHLDNFFITS